MGGVHHVDDFLAEVFSYTIKPAVWLPEVAAHALHIAHRKGAAGSETLVAAGQCAHVEPAQWFDIVDPLRQFIEDPILPAQGFLDQPSGFCRLSDLAQSGDSWLTDCADALRHADRLEADALDQIFHLPNTHASDQPARYHREFIVDRVADKGGRVEGQEGQRLG